MEGPKTASEAEVKMEIWIGIIHRYTREKKSSIATLSGGDLR
jgi:hypothetical protein